MSKFVIVFCVAVFASATCAATVETAEALMPDQERDRCIEDMIETGKLFIDNLVKNVQLAAFPAYYSGISALDGFLDKVRASELTISGEAAFYYPSLPIRCRKDIVEELKSLIDCVEQNVLASLDITSDVPLSECTTNHEFIPA